MANNIIDVRNFLAMDLDSSDEIVEPGYTRENRNVYLNITDSREQGSAENVKGMEDVFSEALYSLPTGDNQCVGVYNDDYNGRLILLIWNSNNDHRVLIYDGANVNIYGKGSVLDFAKDRFITDIDLVDNNLYWVDGNKEPRHIYLSQSQNYDWNNPIESYVTNQKIVPNPPKVKVKDTNKISKLDSNAYQFATRFVFKSKAKSVWSGVSKLAVVGYENEDLDTIEIDWSDSNFNLSQYQDVIESVEIAFRDFYTFTWKFFKKVDYSVNPAVIDFIEESRFSNVSDVEYLQPYSNIPREVGTQTVMKDKLFYANNLIGYNEPTLNITSLAFNVSSNNIPDVENCGISLNERLLKDNSLYSWGVVLYDKFGRKSSVIDVGLDWTTPAQKGNNYKAYTVTFNLDTSQLPSWVEDFQIVKSENLYYNWFVQGRVTNVYYVTEYDANSNPEYGKPGSDDPGVGNENTGDNNTIEIHLDTRNWLKHDTNIPYNYENGDKLRILTLGGADDKAAPKKFNDIDIKRKGGVNGTSLVVDYNQIGNYNLYDTAYAENSGGNLGYIVVGEAGFLAYKIGFLDLSNDDLYQDNPTLAVLTDKDLFCCACFIENDANDDFSYIVAGEAGKILKLNGDNSNGWVEVSDLNVFDGNINAVTKTIESFDPVITLFLYFACDNGVILELDFYSGILSKKTTPTSENLNDITFLDETGNEKFIAVGDNGTIIYSNDGIDWNLDDTITICEDFNGVDAYWNGSAFLDHTSPDSSHRAVIVGDNGVILIGTIGDWTVHKSGNFNNLNATCLFHGRSTSNGGYGDIGDLRFSGEAIDNIVNTSGNEFRIEMTSSIVTERDTELTIIISGASNTGNNGEFTIINVSAVNDYIFINNPNGITENSTGATADVRFPAKASLAGDNGQFITVDDIIKSQNDIQFNDQTINLRNVTDEDINNVYYIRMALDSNGNYEGGICADNNTLVKIQGYESKDGDDDFLEGSATNQVTNLQRGHILNYGAKIEVYRPKEKQKNVLYYEYGKYFKNDSSTKSITLGDDDGDVYFIKKDFAGHTDPQGTGTNWSHLGDIVYAMTPRESDVTGDFIEPGDNQEGGTGWEKDHGRVNVINPDGDKAKNLDTQIVFSNAYVEDSNINGLSNFELLNNKDLPNEYGSITTLTSIDNIMISLCERELVAMYIDESIITDQIGQESITKSNQVINNARRLRGGYGCIHPESVVNYGSYLYYYSHNKSAVVRYSVGGGAFPVSNYRAKKYFRDFGKNLSNEKLHAGYDPYFSIYYLRTLDGDVIGFQDGTDGWICFYDYYGERFGFIDLDFYSLINGKLYRHHTGSDRLKLVNSNGELVSYNAEVQPVFNKQVQTKKDFRFIEFIANSKWHVPEIKTPEGQETYLNDIHIERIDNRWYGTIMGNINTLGASSNADGWANGEFMQSHVVTAKFRYSGIDKAIIKTASMISSPNMFTF